jgi:hypothetical protein
MNPQDTEYLRLLAERVAAQNDDIADMKSDIAAIRAILES